MVINDDGAPMKFKKGWSSHMPLVIKAIQATDGPVLELGSGFFSTPLMHWLCAEDRRKVVTYESVPEYMDFARQFTSRTHSVHLVKDWDKIDIENTHWSVVLIDHVSDRRAVEALRLKNNADYIILHDTQGEDKWYHYDQVWPEFKYIYHWQFSSPWVSVVSNFKDMEIFK